MAKGNLLARWLLCPKLGKEDGAVNFQEAWLNITHWEQIATYQLRDQPWSGSLLQDLQPVDGARGPAYEVPSYLNRSPDLAPSLAVVGEKAPSRGKAAETVAAKAAPSRSTPVDDIFSQLRNTATTPNSVRGKKKAGDAAVQGLPKMV